MTHFPTHNNKTFAKLNVLKLLFFPIIITTLIFLSSSCRRYSPDKLISYVTNPKNGLIQEKVINGTYIKLTYKPSDLIAVQELKVIDTLSKEKIQEIQKRYKQQYYFLLSISLQGKEILHSAADREWFSSMVNTLSFGMNEYVSLVNEQQDTLKLLTYNYPRMYGMSASTDILFVFERRNLNSNDILTFKIEDFGLYTGDLKFRIRVKDVNKVPHLRDITEND